MRASRGISIHTGMAFLRNEFYNMSIYRVSFWINLFYTFLMMYSVGYVWRALYAANPNVSGVPLPQMISYAVLGVALEAILHPRNGPQIYIMEQVRKGTIEMDIMKPIDFQFYMFAKNMGSIAVRFLFLVLPSLIVAFFLFSLKLPDLSALFAIPLHLCHSHVHLYWKLCGNGYVERIRCAVYMDTCTRVIITSVDETGLCQSNDTGRLRKCGTFDYMVIFCVWLFWEKHNIRLIFLWG